MSSDFNSCEAYPRARLSLLIPKAVTTTSPKANELSSNVTSILDPSEVKISLVLKPIKENTNVFPFSVLME